MAPMIELRDAVADDVSVIGAIWHAAWHDGHGGHVPEGLLVHRDESEFLRRARNRVPSTRVGLVDGRVAGFAAVADDEVEELFVDAWARGSGVARALLADAEAEIAAAHPVAWLAVVAGNARARAFYEREGWHDAGELAYEAETADGVFVVPSHRYEKQVRD